MPQPAIMMPVWPVATKRAACPDRRAAAVSEQRPPHAPQRLFLDLAEAVEELLAGLAQQWLLGQLEGRAALAQLDAFGIGGLPRTFVGTLLGALMKQKLVARPTSERGQGLRAPFTGGICTETDRL